MNPTTDTPADVVQQTVERAHACAPALANSGLLDRARWLEAVAAGLRSNTEQLVQVAGRETQLGHGRLAGEVERTAVQLQHFADALRDGSYLEATLDLPDLTTAPPRPDLRRMLRPLGVVAVFGASNFPFAFSVLGNDTASALAAGCPVVVKGHPGHPETSSLTVRLALEALSDAGAPEGSLSIVFGMQAGVALVQAPGVKAVGFTGSEHGGRALFDMAAARPDPIPFYGELGSLNPVIISRAAAEERPQAIAEGMVRSVTNDGGQLCTKPGVVFVPTASTVEAALEGVVASASSTTLLTQGIAQSFVDIAGRMSSRPGVEVVAGRLSEGTAEAHPVVLGINANLFAAEAGSWLEECFGPLTLLVRYDTPEELSSALAAVPGSLAAAIHLGSDESGAEIASLVHDRVGRIVFNGWPTGVSIALSQHHGGPWPATTASIHSSVGGSSIRRWLSPIAYQDAPAEVLPPALQDGNPLGIPRRVNGEPETVRVA